MAGIGEEVWKIPQLAQYFPAKAMNLTKAEGIGYTADAAPSAVAPSVAALLRSLIDYAGLFPPASLGMAQAVANYETYLRSDHGWILGRFILPAARLGEFGEALARLPASHAERTPRWSLSVLLGADPSGDLARIREFNARAAAASLLVKPEIQSVEVKITAPDEIEPLSAIIPSELEAYCEVPLSGAERDLITAIAACGRRAKIRTGGETADKFPSPESVVEFIQLCAAANVAFKATAGLHHPLRSSHPFTYQPDSPNGIMHGFLNVFLAAAFLRAGMEPPLALQLLTEQSPQGFQFDSEAAMWREHRLTVPQIAAARKDFAVSFGSCSFIEPLDDLRSLHLL